MHWPPEVDESEDPSDEPPEPPECDESWEPEEPPDELPDEPLLAPEDAVLLATELTDELLDEQILIQVVQPSPPLRHRYVQPGLEDGFAGQELLEDDDELDDEDGQAGPVGPPHGLQQTSLGDVPQEPSGVPFLALQSLVAIQLAPGPQMPPPVLLVSLLLLSWHWLAAGIQLYDGNQPQEVGLLQLYTLPVTLQSQPVLHPPERQSNLLGSDWEQLGGDVLEVVHALLDEEEELLFGQ